MGSSTSAAREWNSSSVRRAFETRSVRRRELEGLGVERHGQVRADHGQTLREERRLLVLAQALANLALDRVRLREQMVEVAVLQDPFLRRDLAHAGHPGDVVGGVPHQGQHVGDLPRGDAEEVANSRLIQEPFAARVVDAHVRGDQLQHVLVGRHDDGVVAPAHGLDRDGSDDVVGLVTGLLQDRNPVGFARPLDEGDLALQVLFHLGPVGLVRFVGLVADGLSRQVEGGRDGVGLVLAQHLLQHRQEAVNGVGGLARGGRKARIA